MRQKLMQCTFVTEQEYQAKREEVHLCIEHALKKLPENEVILVEIAINEAINNAFRAGSGQTLVPAVTLSLSLLESQCLCVRIKDAGSGFCAEEVLSDFSTRTCENNEEWQWGESGRGLFIMETVMDQVHYNAKGNAVSLLKNI
ncbi:ATP-binding protein [Desulfitobacterium metallireducens]|uniref:Anti-sigma regulatory factor, serine/threonine protein kinase n=1 Tax=Desulfitobacterium metallireducens DSM 15288 TaxID=871968 RepID=W0EB29_9FIRM|nr:ATP-binding protein [Desulfitobacterium metallireducens]AHF06429.1 anti-sigma regulatory factor, serine/threonine protein kinase [Desulfitobacterium metallireducens DSM 15288]